MYEIYHDMWSSTVRSDEERELQSKEIDKLQEELMAIPPVDEV